MATTETLPSEKQTRPSGWQAIGQWCDRHMHYLFPAPSVLVLGALMAFPVAYTVWMSLHDWNVSSLAVPQWVGLKNYLDILLRDTRFWDAFWRTAAFTGGAVAIQLVLGLVIALTLDQEMAGGGLVRTLFLLPMMATPAAIALVWTLMMNPRLGVLNYLLSLAGVAGPLWIGTRGTVLASLMLVDIWQWTPLIALICLAGLSVLPNEPYEAARIDGASPWQIFWHITLPLLRPAIVVALVFRLIDAVKTFDIIYVMTQGGPGSASETLNIYIYNSAFQYLHMGYASALLVLFFILILGLSAVLIRLRRVAW